MNKRLFSPTPSQEEVHATPSLLLIQPHAAGADLGSEPIQICIPGPDNT